MRLPVTGSTCMQYLEPALSAGAGIAGAGSRFAADNGDVATTMLKATTNPLCAMAFLLDGNPGMSFQDQSLALVATGRESFEFGYRLPPFVEKANRRLQSAVASARDRLK